jgi:PAS domain S-box-containing protein/putative nucleotidyltransferase with HDIG domain
MDSKARRETDKMIVRQISEFRQRGSYREEELQNISTELTIGLSEVMEALKKVSSGNPSVRISEASDIELISKLKKITNLTAENLEKDFNQFLNFSMDFAVYFEVLQRVASGDLDARVTGHLNTELSQTLQAVTNKMIESISGEINGHKHAQQALEESERKYLDLYQNAPDGYHSVDPDGTILEVNNTWLKMLGYEKDEVAGIMKFQDLLTEKGREIFQKIFSQLKKEGKTNNTEYHLKKKDGSLLPVLINDSTIYDEQGEFLKSRSIVRNISERFRYRKKLEQSIGEWRTTFDSMPYGVMILDMDFTIKRVNKYVSELYNYSFTELIDRKCFEIIQSKQLRKYYSDLISDNVISSGIFESYHAKTDKIFLLYLTPIPDAEGLIKSFILAMVDITEIKLKEKELDISYKKLNELFEGLILSFVNAIDAKSSWTKGHSERVTNYALAIAKEMGLDKEEIETLRIAALLHDIGKIGTYDMILDKPNSLTREEFNLINMHPIRGVEILQPIYQLKHLLPIIKHHHERVDGRGYPNGLKGNEIPLLSRIICVADSYDSMASDRPYRAALGKEHAIEELRSYSGIQFDPDVVEAFLRSMLRTENFQKAVQN